MNHECLRQYQVDVYVDEDEDAPVGGYAPIGTDRRYPSPRSRWWRPSPLRKKGAAAPLWSLFPKDSKKQG